jgi:hypothetical protein
MSGDCSSKSRHSHNVADPDPFPSSYPFFAPSSWSSILPKTRQDIVEAPKDKCGAATNQQTNKNKCCDDAVQSTTGA